MNEPAKPPLQLQLGRYYRADDNNIYGPLVQIGLDHLFSAEFCTYVWKRDGSPALSGEPRLLEEVPEPTNYKPDPATAPLSLEEGGYYRADNGLTYGPLMRLVGSSAGQNVFCYGVKVWNSDGSPVWDTGIRLLRKVEKPTKTLISSKEHVVVLRGKTSQELDDAFRDYVASLNGAISKGAPASNHSRPTSWELFPVGQPKAGPFDVEEPKSECKHKSVCIVDRDPMEAVVVRCGESHIAITQEEWPVLSQIITTALSHCRKTTKP